MTEKANVINAGSVGKPGWITRLSQRLASRRLVALLIALLMLSCLVGVLIPQEHGNQYSTWSVAHPTAARFVDTVGLNRFFSSTPFIALLGISGLSVLASLFLRGKELIRRAPDADRSRIRLLWVRRGLLGSMIFHAGLLGIIIGGGLSALTRAEGNFIVTEGQTVLLDKATLISNRLPRWWWTMDSPLEIQLKKFHPTHVGRWGTPDYASDLVVMAQGNKVKQKRVYVNAPLSVHGVTLYQNMHGFSTLLEIRDKQGAMNFRSWVALNTEMEEVIRYADLFRLPGTEILVEAELFPDPLRDGENLINQSPELKQPSLKIKLRKGQEVLYDDTMDLDSEVTDNERFMIGFKGIRYWSEFRTVRDRGTALLFICAWFSVAGLCLRFTV